jgi:branched-chain amino acid transport system substrate-binding protein
METLFRTASVLLLTSLAVGCAAPPAPSVPTERPTPPTTRTQPAEEEPEPLGPLRIALLLPRTGSPALQQYGELVLEGARIAVQEFEDATGRPVDLAVLDDEGDAAAAASLVVRLERDGTYGVVGPLLSDALAAAAQARSYSQLVIVSPTASELPAATNVFSIGAPDAAGPRALARYVAQVGLAPVAVLYPRMAEYLDKAHAFSAEAAAAGVPIAIALPYDSGTTTFAAQLRAIARTAPAAIYIPAPLRDVLQIAPQLAYYGLRSQSVQILGDENWIEPEARRRLPPEVLDGTIAAAAFYLEAPELRWNQFLRSFESRYRRTLDNLFPGYGYDATWLLLDAAAEAAAPAEVAAGLGMRQLRGATAVLELHEGRLVRKPFLVRIAGRELVPAPPPAAYVPPAALFAPPDTATAGDDLPPQGRR